MIVLGCCSLHAEETKTGAGNLAQVDLRHSGDMDPVAKAISRHRHELMEIPAVKSVLVGPEDASILVEVDQSTPELARRIPMQLEGWPVELVASETDDSSPVVLAHSDLTARHSADEMQAYRVVRSHYEELAKEIGVVNLSEVTVEAMPNGKSGIVLRLRPLPADKLRQIPHDLEGIPVRVVVLKKWK
jgi:hypothetical protein